jgi:hypothetical protein
MGKKENQMEIKTTVVNAIGILDDAKKVRALVESGAAGKKGSRRDSIYGDRRTEGEVFKLNPTLDVNLYKAFLKEIDEDVLNLQRAVFSFNSSTKIGDGLDLTVAEALREVERLNTVI